MVIKGMYEFIIMDTSVKIWTHWKMEIFSGRQQKLDKILKDGQYVLDLIYR